MAATIRRVSRRTLFTDFGAAGMGLVILGACTGSGSSTAGSSAGTETQPESDADTGTELGTETTGSPPTTTGSTGSNPEEQSVETVSSASSALQFEHVSLGFVSAYVLVRGNEAAVVDTGSAGSRGDILAGLAAFSLAPSSVSHIVLTHNHSDHAGGLSDLEADLTGATVYGGVGDIESIQSSLAIQELSDGDEVFGMGVVGTPGHTPGSISLFDADTGLLVAGDAINGDGEGGLIGANPRFTPDLDAAAASVEKLAALMPSIAAFGHGGPPVSDDVAAKLAGISAG